MRAPEKTCSLSDSKFRGYSSCQELAEYRARVTLSSGREFLVHLCYFHMPRAFEIAEAVLERRFPEEDLSIRGIGFHELKPISRLKRQQRVQKRVA